MNSSPPRQIRLLCIMICIACLSGFSTDIYIPSFSHIAHDFNTNMKHVQWTMAIYMLGVSISQLFYGPISEGFGRRPPLIFGLLLMLLASIGCTFSSNITILLCCRFFQGLGAGACASLWRSIFRDAFDITKMATYGSYLGMAMVFIVPSSPMLGGILQDKFHWRYSFGAVIIAVGIVLGLVLFFLRETNKNIDPKKLSLTFFKSASLELLSSPIFMGYTFCTFLTYGAFFSWFVVGPVLMIEGLKMSPETFGRVNFMMAIFAMGGAVFTNKRLLPKYGPAFMLRLGWGCMITGATILLVWNALCTFTIYSIIPPLLLFFFGSAFIWPVAFASAFTPFGHIAGYAGSLYSFMQLGGGAVVGWLASFLPKDQPNALAFLFLSVTALALLTFEFYIRPKEKKNAPQK